MPPVPLMAVVAKMASDCDSSPLYRQRPPSPQRLFEQDTIELDCVGRERSHHRVLLTVGGASVCCASSSRLHSHSERAGSIGVRSNMASRLLLNVASKV